MTRVDSLVSKRLVLREYEEADFEATHAFAADPEVVRYMEWGPNGEEESRNFIRRVLDQQQEEPRVHYVLAVALKDGELIGNCSLSVSDRESREAVLGYTYNRRFWGMGYASEAAAVVVDFGFRQLALHRIYAKCVIQNRGSARVMEKLGMKREGLFREHRLVRGEWKDYFYYAILEQEWEGQ